MKSWKRFRKLSRSDYFSFVPFPENAFDLVISITPSVFSSLELKAPGELIEW